MNRLTLFLPFFVMLLACAVFAPLSGEAGEGKRVLILHSYHHEYGWTDGIDKGIQAVFANATIPIETRTEFMDGKYLHTDAQWDLLAEVYGRKFENAEFDLIVSSDNIALEFLKKWRDRIFPGVPVVFCGVNGFDPSMVEGNALFTGVAEEVSVRDTVELMLRLFPGRSNVSVVVDTSRSGMGVHHAILEAAQSLAPEVRFTFCREPVLARVVAVIEKLSDDTLVLYAAARLRDEAGKFLPFQQAARILSQKSSQPLFSLWDFMIGSGVVGGKVTSGPAQGRAAAEIGLRILGGDRPGAIPVLRQSPNRYMFDAVPLGRFGLDPADLPEGSQVLNLRASFYEANRPLVLGGIGALLSLVGVIAFLLVNMTARLRAEHSLRKSEEVFRRAFELGVVGMAMTSPEKRWMVVNEELCRMLGYTAEELLEKTWEELTHPDDLTVDLAEFNRVLAGGDEQYTMDKRFIRKDGSIVKTMMAFRAIRKPDGAMRHGLAIILDITQREAAEKALRESEENLAITLDSIGDAVIATDAGRKVVRMNSVAQALTGWSLAEAKGRRLCEVLRIIDGTTGKEIPVPAMKVFATGEVVALESNTILVAKDGRELRIADSAAPMRNGKKEIVGVVLVFRDVTEKYRLEQQVRQSQKMDSIGQLAGGVAHDFNNMLTGIIGYAEVLNLRVGKDKKLSRYTDAIIETGEKAADLTRKLLAFSRKGKIHATPVDVHAAIGDAMGLLERSIDRRITIEKRLGARKSVVIGDPSQIQNVVLNLGLNARDAMPGGGTLAFATENVALDAAYCDASPFDIRPGDYIDIAVTDTGCGMEKAVVERIFEPFFTTKEVGRGTGLGLSAAYGSIKDHNGAVTVYSEKDVGSEFHLYLPLDEPAERVREERETPAAGSGCILVVDDERIVRDISVQILENIGYIVLTARDGMEALEIYRKEGSSISLVLLDMVMPKMDGKETYFALRQIDPAVRVMLVSGYSRSENISVLIREEGLTLLHKPFRRGELVREVAKALRAPA